MRVLFGVSWRPCQVLSAALFTLLMCAMGCQVRAYMIPQIVRGERDQAARFVPNQRLCKAVTVRDGSRRAFDYTLSMSGPETLLYQIAATPQVNAATLFVNERCLVFCDAGERYLERFLVAGPSDAAQFWAVRRLYFEETLRNNIVTIDKGTGTWAGSWIVRSVPRRPSEWNLETVIYMDDATKRPRRFEALDSNGGIRSAFWLKQEQPLAANAQLVEPTAEPGWQTHTLDFAAVAGIRDATLTAILPLCVERWHLTTALEQEGAIYCDYSSDGNVLAAALIPRADLGPVYPFCIEIRCRQRTVYYSQVGTFSMLTYSIPGYRAVLLSNLGAGMAFALMDCTESFAAGTRMGQSACVSPPPLPMDTEIPAEATEIIEATAP